MYWEEKKLFLSAAGVWLNIDKKNRQFMRFNSINEPLAHNFKRMNSDCGLCFAKRKRVLIYKKCWKTQANWHIRFSPIFVCLLRHCTISHMPNRSTLPMSAYSMVVRLNTGHSLCVCRHTAHVFVCVLCICMHWRQRKSIDIWMSIVVVSVVCMFSI